MAQGPARDGRQEPAGRARRRRPRRPPSNCAVQGAYFSTGQRCTASSRLIVTEGIHDRFVAALTERAEGARGRRRADGRAPRSARWSTRASSTRTCDYIEIGKSEGAKLACGGERLEARRPKASTWRRRCSPTRRNAMRISREEIFGPVACVIRVEGLRRGAGARQRHRVRPVAGHRAPPRSSTRRTSSGTRRPAW